MAFVLRVVILFALALAPAQASALEAEGPIEPAIPRDGVVAAVLRLLEGATPAGSDMRQAELDALKAYYERPGAKPIWSADGEPSEVAGAASDEIARAGDYGLDATDFELPALDAANRAVEDLGRIELQLSRAVLLYARYAKGGRVDPGKIGSQLQQAPLLPEPAAVLEAIAASADPAAHLRSLHPTHPQFVALRKKLAELRATKATRATAEIPDGSALRRGDRDARVALLRKRLKVAAGTGPADGKRSDPNLFDEAVEAAVKRFQKENGLSADGIVGPGTRRALNGGSPEVRILQILVNMERWRWLPDDLGGNAGIYVWANIPEFRVRVVEAGKTVFSERVIVGKVDKQTPVFSDEMEWIEFHPTWYVPNSIKVDDILPSLRRPTSSVMERYNLKLHCGRHGSDPKAIDWSSVDIRNCSVSQPPGKASVLGDFKFKFPNRHDVYMHDTPTKRLFQHATRTFSHGCVRIQNPRRMAEILLAHDKQMSADRVGEILAGPQQLHKEEFNRHVPVHITYFTAVFDDDGKFTTRPDYYGHDRRLAQTLTGKGDLLPAAPAPVTRTSRKKKRPVTQTGNWWQPNFLQN